MTTRFLTTQQEADFRALINEAFKVLRKARYIARQKTDAYEMTLAVEKDTSKIGWVGYDRQSAETIPYGTLYVSYEGSVASDMGRATLVGQEAVRFFNSISGLRAEWDGKPSSSIKVIYLADFERTAPATETPANPNTMNRAADDISAQPAVKTSKQVKLSEAQGNLLKVIATNGGYLPILAKNATYNKLVELGLITKLVLVDNGNKSKVELTDAGRDYAIAQGWIAAPTPPIPTIPPLQAGATSAFKNDDGNMETAPVADPNDPNARTLNRAGRVIIVMERKADSGGTMDKKADSDVHSEGATGWDSAVTVDDVEQLIRRMHANGNLYENEIENKSALEVAVAKNWVKALKPFRSSDKIEYRLMPDAFDELDRLDDLAREKERQAKIDADAAKDAELDTLQAELNASREREARLQGFVDEFVDFLHAYDFISIIEEHVEFDDEDVRVGAVLLRDTLERAKALAASADTDSGQAGH